MYKYIRDAWKNPDKSYVKELMRTRTPIWRRESVIVRVDDLQGLIGLDH